MSLDKLEFVIAKVCGKKCVIVIDHFAFLEEGIIHLKGENIDGTVILQSYSDNLSDIKLKCFFPGLSATELIASLREETSLFFTIKSRSDTGIYEYAISKHI